MNFTPKQKAWISLIALVFSAGATIGVGAWQSGSHPVAAVVLGLGAAGTAVFTALKPSPHDAK